MNKKIRWKQMMLVKRSYVLFLTVTTSATLLILQLILLKQFVHLHETTVLLTEEVTSRKLLRSVLSEAENQGVCLFIADGAVLKGLKQKNSNVDSCYELCGSRRAIRLASLVHLLTRSQREKFIYGLLSKGVELVIAEGHDPNLHRHGLGVQVPYSAFIFADNSAVILHFLYERPGGYWWQGAINTSQTNRLYEKVLRNLSITIPSYENAYNKFEIYPATVDGIRTFLPLHFSNSVEPGPLTRFVECNHTRSKIFYNKHKPDNTPEAESFRKKAWRLVSRAKSILDELNIPFWLSSGTCLGYFRQCDFITYSKDVDIGIRIENFDVQIIDAFSTNGLPLTHWFGKVQDSLELSFRDGDLKLDIFFFYEEHDHIWNGGTQARTGRKFKYIFPKFDLCWTEFLELRVRVPCTTQKYIEANYGANWMEPTEVWDWKKDPSNVRDNGQWPIEEWGEVIRLMSIPET